MVAAAGHHVPVTDRREYPMKILYAAVLAGLVAFTTPTLAASTRGASQGLPRADSVQGGKLAVGLICKNARDLRNLFRARAWTQPRPDPELAVRQVNALAHDPKACELRMLPYKGEPEQVDRLVRGSGELYTIVRFTPLYPHEPGQLYMLLPGK